MSALLGLVTTVMSIEHRGLEPASDRPDIRCSDPFRAMGAGYTWLQETRLEPGISGRYKDPLKPSGDKCCNFKKHRYVVPSWESVELDS